MNKVNAFEEKKILHNLLIMKGHLELECVGPQDLCPETERALSLLRVSELAWLMFRKFALSLWIQIPTLKRLLNVEFLMWFHLSSVISVIKSSR